MTIHLRRWDDVGAPVLNNAAGSMIALLDAILVNGYDTQPGLGWTVLYEDAVNNKKAWKMPVGTSERVLWCHDDGSYDSGQSCKVNMYDSMTDIDTGACPFGKAASYWSKTYNTSYANEWVFVSDGAFVYFYSNWHGTTYKDRGNLWYFGDLVPTGVGAAGPRTTFGATDIVTQSYPSHGDDSWNYAPGDGQSRGGCPSSSGAIPASGELCAPLSLFSYSNYSVFGRDYFNGGSGVDACGISKFTSPIYCTFGNSAAERWIAGRYPGILRNVIPQSYLDHLTTHTDIPEYPGRTFLGLSIQPNGTGATDASLGYIDLTGPWR